MRPAQKAPENKPKKISLGSEADCFNEAGAKSAGKRERWRDDFARELCFNEAGAKSAGKRIRNTARTCSRRPLQ